MSSDEESYRLGVWMDNKDYIDNNQGKNFTLSINMFADLTDN